MIANSPRNPVRRSSLPLRWRRTLREIDRVAVAFRTASDAELRRASLSLRYRAYSGERLERMAPEAFALVSEAARRSVGQYPYDVQHIGGVALITHSVAEMQTGEGKTLTAILPLYLAALESHGAHLATANDYLALRDASFVRPIFELLGMQVGVVQAGTSRQERHQAYACDVTYGAAREFGFDFLRDRLNSQSELAQGRDTLGRMLGIDQPNENRQTLQRGLHFMLVDEADSILIDEARTPLVVSSMPGSGQAGAATLFRWAAGMAQRLQEHQEYSVDPARQSIQLTAAGRRRVREFTRPEALRAIALIDLYDRVELAIRVRRFYTRDRHYVLRDGEVVIVDESTGRLAEGRKWRDGVHQAVEAKEGVSVTVDAGEAARVSVQHFFLRYSRLSGMTGTAHPSHRELKRIYGLVTHAIPTHRPVQRRVLTSRIFGNSHARWEAVAAEAQEISREGRPVLIGTRSIEKSERLSELLRESNIAHSVLNAHRHAEEAAIVASAGQAGRVTVATNMAGRGTDIELGEQVAERGGLHVIGTEFHESQRIDRQLYGRCGRQGDPGSVRQYAALDDDLLDAAYGTHRAGRLRQIGKSRQGEFPRLEKLFRRAQSRLENKHFQQRRLLLFHEQQRLQAQRELGQDPYLDAAM